MSSIFDAGLEVEQHGPFKLAAWQDVLLISLNTLVVESEGVGVSQFNTESITNMVLQTEYYLSGLENVD